jgi:hypothetical protein
MESVFCVLQMFAVLSHCTCSVAMQGEAHKCILLNFFIQMATVVFKMVGSKEAIPTDDINVVVIVEDNLKY